MVWSGIPFPFIDSLTNDNIVLQISKLPTLMVDSGFPWESLLGSLIAGSIPVLQRFILMKGMKLMGIVFCGISTSCANGHQQPEAIKTTFRL
ncbi:hypothetical protein HVW65_14005 [Citrobacter freundii]|nr:hypothetical protein HVW65_14005 [Citrobacter freundii]